MHNNGTTIRYCKIPNFNKYEINSFSEIRLSDTKEIIPVYIDRSGFFRVRLENDYGDIVEITQARVMLLTFVGELNLPIKYKTENLWDNTIKKYLLRYPRLFH